MIVAGRCQVVEWSKCESESFQPTTHFQQPSIANVGGFKTRLAETNLYVFTCQVLLYRPPSALD